jgi:hypothetical protein
VVVDSDGEGPLGALLAHHVLLEHVVDLPGLGEVLELEGRRCGELLVDDLVAEIDALVTDVDAGPGDELLDLALRLPAEAAEELLVGFGGTCQWNCSLGLASPGRLLPRWKLRRPPASARRILVTPFAAGFLPSLNR